MWRENRIRWGNKTWLHRAWELLDLAFTLNAVEKHWRISRNDMICLMHLKDNCIAVLGSGDNVVLQERDHGFYHVLALSW